MNVHCIACGNEWDFKGNKKPKCPKCGSYNIAEKPFTELETGQIDAPIEPPQEAKQEIEFPSKVDPKSVGAGLDLITGLLSKVTKNEVFLLSKEDHDLVDRPTALIIEKYIAWAEKIGVWGLFVGSWGMVIAKKWQTAQPKIDGGKKGETEEVSYLESLKRRS